MNNSPLNDSDLQNKLNIANSGNQNEIEGSTGGNGDQGKSKEDQSTTLPQQHLIRPDSPCTKDILQSSSGMQKQVEG